MRSKGTSPGGLSPFGGGDTVDTRGVCVAHRDHQRLKKPLPLWIEQLQLGNQRRRQSWTAVLEVDASTRRSDTDK